MVLARAWPTSRRPVPIPTPKLVAATGIGGRGLVADGRDLDIGRIVRARRSRPLKTPISSRTRGEGGGQDGRPFSDGATHDPQTMA